MVLKQQRHITPNATEEIILDGYRIEVVRKSRTTTLYSRRENVLNQKFPYLATALEHLPKETVIDGEVVVVHEGRTNFSELQADLAKGSQDRLLYCAFDLLWLDV